jgi:citrate lyase subunit beta/citryl-CoA lyase
MIKALQLQEQKRGRFDVTLDLEDGAPRGSERDHAELVVSLLVGERNVFGRAGVRIHEYDSSHWRRDVNDVVQGAGKIVSHITIPKVLGAPQLAEMITAIQHACAVSEVGRQIPIHVLIETHAAVQDAYKIAGMPWLRSLEFGIMDFVSSHHGAVGADAMHSPGQFEHMLVKRAKVRQVSAALGNGLVPVHNVTLNVKDTDLVAADARRARREFGYLRMWSIHPVQIDPILEAFGDDPVETALASRIMLAARDADWGPISLDGRLYDRASFRFFWQVLERARHQGHDLPEEAEAAFFDAAEPS